MKDFAATAQREWSHELVDEPELCLFVKCLLLLIIFVLLVEPLLSA